MEMESAGLQLLLGGLGLGDRVSAASRWCCRHGVVHVAMIAEADRHTGTTIAQFLEMIDATGHTLTLTQRAALHDRLLLARDAMHASLSGKFAAPYTGSERRHFALTGSERDLTHTSSPNVNLASAPAHSATLKSSTPTTGPQPAAALSASPVDVPSTSLSSRLAPVPDAVAPPLAVPAVPTAAEVSKGSSSSDLTSGSPSSGIPSPNVSAILAAEFNPQILSPVVESPSHVSSSDDEETSSNSVMGHHHHSPSWSPKVAARKLAADKLHKIPSFKKLLAHKDKDKDKDKDKEKPVDPLAESMKRRKAAQAASPAPEPAAPEQASATEGAASDKATLAEQGFVPPTPLFKRRIADKETRAAKLSHLASVANGKYPTAGGRLNSTGRPVYHSTVW